MNRLTVVLLILLCGAIIVCPGCKAPENKITIAFVPSVESQTIIEQLAAFDADLSARLGTKVKSDVMPNYAACVEAMGTGQVDVAFLPPMAYVLGHSRYGIDVLLKVERKGKTVYRGEIIVRNDSGINTIEDLEGKKIAFVEASSASGHLYAKALLREHGIDVDKEKDAVLFTGSHPSVVQAVLQGTVDAGACYEDARDQVKDIAPGVMEETKIIAYTADIPADTVSVRREVPSELRGRIAEALKEMATGKEGVLYAIYQIEKLHDATDADYEPLREVGKTLGIDFAEYVDKK